MAKHNTVGVQGELLAINWFKAAGFEILATNWRHKRLEADIIASKENTLHIIEVKTRTNTTFGYPEESVSHKKIENMLQIGTVYQSLHPQFLYFQFDILSIILNRNNAPEYFYIKDVYI